jgi:DNA-directed RNA polymerase specialized sigma24 family protein
LSVDARKKAIEELYRERYIQFRNALATITGSYESARDVVQEAFVRALRQRRSLRSRAGAAAARDRHSGDLPCDEPIDLGGGVKACP